MRYWAFLLVKLLLSGLIPLLLWLPLADAMLAYHPTPAWPWRALIKLTVVPFYALFCVLLHWAIRDQRFRCRVGLRRLRMPVSSGSYGSLLLDRPATEYICPFGHGKLLAQDLGVAGQVLAWTRYGDVWEELCRD